MMFENLNQPYPFNNNFKHNLRTISLVSMGFILIVLYFQPFGINFLASASESYFVLVMGSLSAGTFFLSTMILPGLFPRLFESKHWTIKKELIWNFGMFLVMVASFALAAYFFGIPRMQSLTLFRSGALAVLPLVLFNFVNYNHSLKTKVVHIIDSGRNWLAEERKSHPATSEAERKPITIESENGKDAYNGGLENVILIQSASNYIEIFYRDGAHVRKQMIRQTLASVESSLANLSNIRKCHRCTLVNIDQIDRLSGTSPNYTLEADGLGFRIPISRQRIALFRKLFAR